MSAAAPGPDVAALQSTVAELEEALRAQAAALDEVDRGRDAHLAELERRDAELAVVRAEMDERLRSAHAEHQRVAADLDATRLERDALAVALRAAGERGQDGGEPVHGDQGRLAAATNRARRAAVVLAGRSTAPPVAEAPPPVSAMDAPRWGRLLEANPALAGAVVRAAYLAVLQREPEAEGLAYHVERLAAGLPVEVLLGDMAEARRREEAVNGGRRGLVAGNAERVVAAVVEAALARPLEPRERDDLRRRIQGGDDWWAVLADGLEAGREDGVAHLRHLVMVQERTLLAVQRRLAAIEDTLLAGDAPPGAQPPA